MPTKDTSNKTDDQGDEELVLISGRVRKSIRRRLRLYAAGQDDLTIQDIIDAALDEYLTSREA